MDFKKIFAEGLSVAIGLIIATLVITIVARLLMKKPACGCGGHSSVTSGDGEMGTEAFQFASPAGGYNRGYNSGY